MIQTEHPSKDNCCSYYWYYYNQADDCLISKAMPKLADQANHDAYKIASESTYHKILSLWDVTIEAFNVTTLEMRILIAAP